VLGGLLTKKRADRLLVERGLAPSRARASAFILAGKVFVGDRRVEKAGESFPAEVEFTIRGPDHSYVSRGGLKLEGALDEFGIDPAGLVAADFGASTGGFTDCLLQRGVTRVYAIDVGYGQLHHRLRTDDRVIVMERTNARHLKPDDLPEVVDLVVIDASFIGLSKLLPAASGILKPSGYVIALVKPQFEAGRDRIGKGGVVRDPEVRLEVIEEVVTRAEALGYRVCGRTDAKIAGPKGNLEALLYLKQPKAHL